MEDEQKQELIMKIRDCFAECWDTITGERKMVILNEGRLAEVLIEIVEKC